MSVLSGKDGTLEIGGAVLLRLASWQIEKTSANRAYAANDTGGAKRRVAGVKDCTGRLEVKAADSGKAPVAEGDIVALALHADGSGDNYYGLSAIVDSIRVEVDISDGKPVAYLIRFSGNGPISAHGVLGKG